MVRLTIRQWSRGHHRQAIILMMRRVVFPRQMALLSIQVPQQSSCVSSTCIARRGLESAPPQAHRFNGGVGIMLLDVTNSLPWVF